MAATRSASESETALQRAITAHPRLFEENRYVYPVVSRRAGGMSIGVNLNPDKICNFDCIYCQVDRTVPPLYREVDMDRLERELRSLLESARSGALFAHPRFSALPDRLKRINDIAFSGDGEPTAYPRFREAVERAAAVKQEMGLRDVKIIAITNATRFHRPDVQAALEIMHRNNGEIWAKLDAGTPAYYGRVERTRIPFERIVENLRIAAVRWPLVIQSLFMRIQGEAPPPEEIRAYGDVLLGILESGGRLKLIQIHTVARPPAEAYVTALSDGEVDRIGALVRERLPAVPVEVTYGPKPDAQNLTC